MKISSGNCPVKITYWYDKNAESIIKFKWDDDVDEDSEDKDEIIVHHTYISDSSNKKTMETGKSFASQPRYYNPKYKADPTSEEVLNTPINGVKIVGLEHRGRGGRAYKVIVKDSLYVDLREDILLDIMKNSAIENGVIKCQMIWCKIRNEMKLVRYNSPLHLAALERGRPKILIKPSDYQVGHIYETKDGTAYALLENGYWIYDYAGYDIASIESLEKSLVNYKRAILPMIIKEAPKLYNHIGKTNLLLKDIRDYCIKHEKEIRDSLDARWYKPEIDKLDEILKL